jgi:2'-5' RNA ligase
MVVSNGLGLGINSFALVSYLSGPLADFLDQVRHDFAPDSCAKAHLTLLPPRPIRAEDPDVITNAWNQLKNQLLDFQPFSVDLGDVEVFEKSAVIYLSVKTGTPQLHSMHEALNTGLLAFQEPFPYHPHVTIAQELLLCDVPAATEFCRWRWSEFRDARHFTVDRLTFVQNTPQNRWTDLAAVDLTTQLAV